MNEPERLTEDKLPVAGMGRRTRHAVHAAGMRALVLMLAGSFAFQAIGACASTAPLDEGLAGSDPIKAALQACRSNAFDGLELDDVEGETVHAGLRGGVLIVEHRPTPGGFIETCGANGSISGAYFPTRPAPKPPADPDPGSPPDFANP